MGSGELLGKPKKLRGNDLRWTSIPSRGSRNTSSRFMLQKPGKKNGISSGSYEPDGSKASLFYIHLKLFLFAFRALLLKTHQLSLDAFVIALKAMQVRNHH